MAKQLPLSNWSLQKALTLEPDPINKARVRMLVLGLALATSITVILIPYYALFGPTNQLVRSSIMLLMFAGLLKIMLSRRVWREVIHVLIVILIALILSNIFYRKYVSLVTVQYALLAIMFGFYGLGSKWGFIYSGIAVAAIVIFIIFFNDNFVPVVQSKSGKLAFVTVLITNFTLIICGHYYFYRSFHRNIRELNKAVKAKSDFLSTMSHELRTPLNSVIGMTGLLLTDNPTESQKDNLNILKFSAESLLTLINDVLDFNKIESEKLLLESVDFNLYELINNISAGKRSRAKSKGLHFELKLDDQLRGVMVKGDPTRLTQIIYNLVSNAIKFTSEGTVSVSVTLLQRWQDSLNVHFSVADSGIGIPGHKIKYVFEPFAQASDQTTREFGGTGLGLSIVKHLLELHNSQIEVKSTEGKGTEFRFDLAFKLAENAVPTPVAAAKEEISLADARILIVEDNAINIVLMKKLLKKWWNIEPSIAENGLQAVEAVSRQDFDIIMMDLHMPVMDGYEATQKIRAMHDPQKSGVYIMALTASVSAKAHQRVTEAGMNDYIHKPFDPEALKTKLIDLYQERFLVK